MEALKTVIWIVNIFSSLAIIALVLMQHGRGADAGASFGGSGSAQGVFGSGGNANFLSRMTGIAATVFFASCLLLGYIHSQQSNKGLDFSTVQQSSIAPAADEQGSTLNPVAAHASAEASAAAASGEAKATNDDKGSALAAAAVGATAGAAAAKLADTKKAETDKKNNKNNDDAKKDAKAPAGKSKKPAKADADKNKKKSSSKTKQ